MATLPAFLSCLIPTAPARTAWISLRLVTFWILWYSIRHTVKIFKVYFWVQWVIVIVCYSTTYSTLYLLWVVWEWDFFQLQSSQFGHRQEALEYREVSWLHPGIAQKNGPRQRDFAETLGIWFATLYCNLFLIVEISDIHLLRLYHILDNWNFSWFAPSWALEAYAARVQEQWKEAGLSTDTPDT